MVRSALLTFVLLLSISGTGSLVDPTAVVHLKIVDAFTGNDLGTARVVSFKSESNGQDYAHSFRSNVAPGIPYDTYRLRLYQDGFYTAERIVVVKQAEVWVVAGLHLGAIDFDPASTQLTGKVQNAPANAGPIWVRITGVHSTQTGDAKVDDSGRFTIGGLYGDKVVLVVWSEGRVLYTSSLTIPSAKPITVDLKHQKTY
ncbi:MAG TPA: hypothetical protein VGA40_05370 [Candidatus Acidoferrales bacterium]